MDAIKGIDMYQCLLSVNLSCEQINQSVFFSFSSRPKDVEVFSI